jgi:hypothetical protein
MYIKDYKLVKENPMLLDLTLKQIDGIINFMWAKDQIHLWKDCVEFNQRLDRSRNQMTFTQVTPDFKDYV